MAVIHILLICRGNIARSQMAQGYLSNMLGPVAVVHSAGTSPNPKKQFPLAIELMAEEGIDISKESSKGIPDLKRKKFDVVATMCDMARDVVDEEEFYPQSQHYHYAIPDPYHSAPGSDEERYWVRQIRELIKASCQDLVARLTVQELIPVEQD